MTMLTDELSDALLDARVWDRDFEKALDKYRCVVGNPDAAKQCCEQYCEEVFDYYGYDSTRSYYEEDAADYLRRIVAATDTIGAAA